MYKFESKYIIIMNSNIKHFNTSKTNIDYRYQKIGLINLRAQWPFATYLYIAGYWAYLQKIYKFKINKTTYWYICNDHKNTVPRSEHSKWIREREFGENMKNYEKLWKMIKIDVY